MRLCACVRAELRKAEECKSEEAWQEGEDSSSELEDEEEHRQNSEAEEEEEVEEEGEHTQDSTRDHMAVFTLECMLVFVSVRARHVWRVITQNEKSMKVNSRFFSWLHRYT